MAKGNRLIISIVLAVCVPLGVFFGAACLRQQQVYWAARKAYLESRRDPRWKPDSYEFLAMGLYAGMTEEEVNQALPQPARAYHHMSQVDPPWNGFLNHYEYEHGPKFAFPLFESGRYLSTEIFLVYFDDKGESVKIYRAHHGLVNTGKISQEIVLRPRDEVENGSGG